MSQSLLCNRLRISLCLISHRGSRGVGHAPRLGTGRLCPAACHSCRRLHCLSVLIALPDSRGRAVIVSPLPVLK